jgi:hypothetical protein
MSNVAYYGTSVDTFQAVGTQNWYWNLGDNTSYWGFSVRPAGANNQVELQSVATVADNAGNQTTILTVSVSSAPAGWPNIRTGGGGSLNFTAIGVSP